MLYTHTDTGWKRVSEVYFGLRPDVYDAHPFPSLLHGGTVWRTYL